MTNKATKADWIDNEYNKADNETKTQLRFNWKRGLTDMIYTLQCEISEHEMKDHLIMLFVI